MAGETRLNDREKFLAERATCLGGSDAGDLLTLPPYGCERRLWFDKKGIPADFEFEETNHVRRGRKLESIAADEFCDEFNASFVGQFENHQIAKGLPYLGVHIDRVFTAEWIDWKLGVLEIKVPTVFSWRSIKRLDSPPQTWTAQVQWGMMVGGMGFGALYVFNPDAFTGLKFDVKPDEKMHAAFRELAEIFWESLTLDTNPADKLPDGDARCYSCRWRTKCKGLGERQFDQSPQEIQEIIDLGGFLRDDSSRLVNIVNLWEEAKADAREADKYKGELKDELASLMKGPKIVMADGRKLVRTETDVPVKAHVQHRVTLNVVK